MRTVWSLSKWLSYEVKCADIRLGSWLHVIMKYYECEKPHHCRFASKHCIKCVSAKCVLVLDFIIKLRPVCLRARVSVTCCGNLLKWNEKNVFVITGNIYFLFTLLRTSLCCPFSCSHSPGAALSEAADVWIMWLCSYRPNTRLYKALWTKCLCLNSLRTGVNIPNGDYRNDIFVIIKAGELFSLRQE